MPAPAPAPASRPPRESGGSSARSWTRPSTGWSGGWSATSGRYPCPGATCRRPWGAASGAARWSPSSETPAAARRSGPCSFPSTRRSTGCPSATSAPTPGVDQIAARLLALKSGQKWSDLYAGRSDKETLDTLRMGYAQAMKALPFHIIGRSARRDQPHDVRGTAEWMRRKYPEEKPGTRPFLMVLDFVQIASGHEPRRDQGDHGAHRPRGAPGGQGLRRRGAPGVHHAPRDARRRRRDHRHPPRPPPARRSWAGATPPGWSWGARRKARSSARATP